MKKYFVVAGCLMLISIKITAQDNNLKYPEPEFTNEVYFLNKESGDTVTRLEKNSSKMEAKTKMGGIGGAENGYTIEGERSPVKLHGGNLSFVFSTGASAEPSSSSSQRDSMMRANGMDPSMMQGIGGMSRDPSDIITLYKVETAKGKRKILMMKMPGAMSFGKKAQSSDKIPFSVKKIRDGYWELVIDKPLNKGEYAFSMMDTGMGSMNWETTLFAFRVE